MGGWHLAHSLYRCLRTLLTSTLPGVHPGCHPLSPFTHVSLPLDQRLHTTKHDLPAIAPYTGFGGPNPLRCRLLTQPNACTTTSTVVVCPSSSPLLAPQTPTPDALLRLRVICLSPGTISPLRMVVMGIPGATRSALPSVGARSFQQPSSLRSWPSWSM